MRATVLLMAFLATPAIAGPFDRPEIAESQRAAWVDFLMHDGAERYRQGRILAGIGAGAVVVGAALSLGETLENGRIDGQVRPGAAIALAGAPLLLAGLPSMAAGTTRMRRALRMEGVLVPAVPVIASWTLLATAAALPLSTLVLDVHSLELAAGAGLLAGGAYALAVVQYRINTDASSPRVVLSPTAVRGGAGLGLTTRW